MSNKESALPLSPPAATTTVSLLLLLPRMLGKVKQAFACCLALEKDREGREKAERRLALARLLPTLLLLLLYECDSRREAFCVAEEAIFFETSSSSSMTWKHFFLKKIFFFPDGNFRSEISISIRFLETCGSGNS